MAILDLVQLNPEILTDDSDYVERLVDMAKEFVVSYCNLPRFPELSAGYSQAAAGGTADISGMSTNRFWISVNGSAGVQIALTLANCTTASLTAAEMQTQIRATDNDYWGFDEVTVAATGNQITVTSGRYGELSAIQIWFDETAKHVCQALRLTPIYGGIEKRGMAADDAIEQATVSIVEQMYRRLGVEGMQSFGMHGEFSGTVQEYADPFTLAQLRSRRRLWAC